jgi:thioesterase domain-containing protein/acyl carrier protein
MIGEICISGAGLSRGYLGRDELTAEKFIPHPLEPGARLYRTGDLGKIMSDGEVVCMGRTDTQIKVRGYRIEAGEIEYTLTSAGGIKETVVIAWEGRQDDTRLTAFMVPQDPGGIEFTPAAGDSAIQLSAVGKDKEAELKKAASASLPDYMIPAAFFYIRELPLTPNGKIDRKALGGMDIIAVMQEMQGGKMESPANEWSVFEKQVRQIWEETLGIRNARLNDNFFESGGHSLIGIELMDKIENRLHMKLPLSSLFAHPTIAGLATFISNNGKSAWKYLVPIKPAGIKPPLYLVHGAGLEVMVFQEITRYMDEDQPIYGIQAMGLNDGGEPAATVEEIAARYLEEILVHNPEGPYALAGFSAGSVIAYEMARQLSARGKKIFFLGNFDYSLENLHRKIPASRKLRNMIIEFVPRQLHNVQNLVKHPSRTARFQANFLKLRIQGILSRLGVDTEEVAELPGMERIWHIMDQYTYALEHYDVKPYSGPMDLFRSRIKLYYLRDKKFLGWSPFVSNIRIHPVEGDHDCMILHPYSKDFALKLQEVLNTNNSGQATGSDVK